MNVLLIGGGGREHALARALAESPSLAKLYAAPGNPGIFELAEQAGIDASDHKAVLDFCRSQAIDLLVIGPEQPLADGLADAARREGIAVFGPDQAAARLESSKTFAKEFMARHNIPTAAFRRFTAAERQAAQEYLQSHSMPVVLKADGLAAGKGVIVCATRDEALQALDRMFDGMFGAAGNTVVVEEFMEGEEASVFAICDGNDCALLASAQDHKQAYDNDRGPNTGGMGAYAPAPIVDATMMADIRSRIIEPVLNGMKQEGYPFVGCLFCGLMIAEGEARVVEFNVRFGDPEAQVVLAVLRADFARLLSSAARGALDHSAIDSPAEGSACCVVLASEGYPAAYEKGKVINGLREAANEDAYVFHAGTASVNGSIVSNGGRVLGVCGQAPVLEEAVNNAYRAAERIEFAGKSYRRDIGAKGIRRLEGRQRVEGD